ncbi:ribosome small subunit-dependent GTPase A [Boudabousia tangfeifanii]|uniref:Small ribosomal subunit biogenesis GTPase RsgA n=1 Tax=Boudabousia tangfeifanii TaxID=1912795 RepID=A0A1D9MJW7_9ACTO|nr:ribosome small subunit-dependent GTPase A [Boudabousia tangfeifanii]AOZ72479.1 ribosome small subunit-dependent GTPase A [Boudabousia tangfeifanii]
MSRYDLGTDDPRVKVRPGKSSRPRSKQRPDHSKKPVGMVIGIDRGRYQVIMADGTTVTAIKARELGRGSVVIGDRVHVGGDISGQKDTLGRIVQIQERDTLLLRSAEEGQRQGKPKPIVANAQQMVIVVALADPPPRYGMIDRCLVAAYEAGVRPLICLTKSDLADSTDFYAAYTPLGIEIVTTSVTPEKIEGLSQLLPKLGNQVSVLVGHSGVGKSTLINAIVPGANRQVGEVNAVTGRGRHTSTSAIAFSLPAGGWVIDTPGVRSFGLAHVDNETLLAAFTDLSEVAVACPRGCKHLADSPQCALSTWPGQVAGEEQKYRQARLNSFRRLIASRHVE